MRKFFKLLVAFAIVVPAVARAEDKPSEIRISYPSVGVGGRPASHSTSVASAHLRGLFEQEFKADGIKISWSFLRGAGPAVNELFANGLVDFSHLGDLPAVIGRASGLKSRIVAATSVRGNVYVAVPSDSNVQSVKDVKYRTSPLIDPYLTSRYKTQITEADRLNLVKNTFSFEEWIEPKFLQRALQELGLQGYWQPRGLDGKPIRPDARRAATAQPKAADPAGG